MRPDADQPPRLDRTADLESAFISEYLERRGHSRETVRQLPDPERHALMRQASSYASMRLAEVETRAHYVDDLKHR
jgi:hypothetical protein